MTTARTSCEQIQLRVRSEYPKPVVFPPESLHSGPLRQIPHSHCLVLAARDDKFVFGVEEGHRDIVEVSSTRVNFPCLRLTHAPDLDLPIVGSGDD